jgi:1-acyl-sn-glycerol-3-phosphate acyltransferase
LNETLYRFVSWGFQELIWGGDLLDADNLPERGPAVFVSNHLGALGPIAIIASVPLQLHTWAHEEMLDPQFAADYVRRDFVERQLHLPRPLSDWLARGIARIHVPLLRGIGCLPVRHTHEGLNETFGLSADLLEQDKCLIVFPEDPGLPADPRTKITPFKKGFILLGQLLYERTKQILPFYPLAVHAQSLTVRVGKPIRYNPFNIPENERIRIRDLLEQSIREMYLRASQIEIVQLPLPN